MRDFLDPDYDRAPKESKNTFRALSLLSIAFPLAVAACILDTNGLEGDYEEKTLGVNGLSDHFDIVAFPECLDDQNRPVRYLSATNTWFKQNAGGRILGWATFHPWTKKPVIVLDAETLSNTPPTFQQQVLMHECFHHKAGDLRNMSPTREDYEQSETMADCNSIKHLRDQKGYRYDDIDEITKYVGIVSKAVGHTDESVAPRLKNIYQCFESPQPVDFKR